MSFPCAASFDDEKEVRERHWHINPGDVVLDVGACEGSYTLPALVMGAAKVYAFDPFKRDADCLRANLRYAGPDYERRCEIVELAIGGKLAPFDGSTSREATEDAVDPVMMTTLDLWLAHRTDIDRIDWIKMDIEGAEHVAIQNAATLIRRFKPRLLIECHSFIDHTMRETVTNTIESWDLGYRFDCYAHHSVHHLFAEVA